MQVVAQELLVHDTWNDWRVKQQSDLQRPQGVRSMACPSVSGANVCVQVYYMHLLAVHVHCRFTTGIAGVLQVSTQVQVCGGGRYLWLWVYRCRRLVGSCGGSESSRLLWSSSCQLTCGATVGAGLQSQLLTTALAQDNRYENAKKRQHISTLEATC